MEKDVANPYRLLPAVEDLVRRPRIAALEAETGRDVLVGIVQDAVDGWRRRIRGGELDAEGVRAGLAAGTLEDEVEARVRRERGSGMVRVVNATGVVLHTGLGRAPVHAEAAAAMEQAARSYVVLEVDRFTAERNQRDERLSTLLSRLTGAEAGIAVNNNAAAVVLALQTFAGGRAAIVSRGELVEIGGSFRIPDVMQRAGVSLREVGTTNRTRAADYRSAVDDTTALLLKVHTSNFRVVGFTQELEGAELGELGRETGLPTVFDLGSGLLECAGAEPIGHLLGGEPLVRAAVADGIDVVTFSGDKLLGGPQAGLLVGKREAIAAMRANPMYRALRLDKVTIAGLETTLELLLSGRGDEIPARAMMLATADEVRARAERIAAGLAGVGGLEVELVDAASQPGSGSAPGVELPTCALAVTVVGPGAGLGASEAAARLRAGEPPVFARIQDERLLLDPRTLLPGDEDDLVAALRALAD